MAIFEFLANRTVQAMITNFSTIFCTLIGCSFLLVRKPSSAGLSFISATSCSNIPKKKTEDWWLMWAVAWIAAFSIIIGGHMYAWFSEWHYMIVCGGLAAPLLLQPFLFPAVTGETNVVWHQVNEIAVSSIPVQSQSNNHSLSHSLRPVFPSNSLLFRPLTLKRTTFVILFDFFFSYSRLFRKRKERKKN